MTEDQKRELVRRVDEEYGIDSLFLELGLSGIHKHSGNVYAVCPFHAGADNPNGFAWSNGFGFCFTQCNRKYDLFNVVMKMKSCDFLEAVTFLAEKVGMEIEHGKALKADDMSLLNRSFLSQVRRMKTKKKAVEWTPIDSKVFLDIEPVLHRMLREEGFDNEIREFFNLGFARAGYLDRRITVPVDYIDGSIVTISGRSILPKEECEKQEIRRYQIWYDTDKAVTLYNISRALMFIEMFKEVYVFEGFKSVWRLYQWGYPNAVATMGTNLSDEQRKLLLKLGAKIIVCGDRDEAGQEFNKKIKEECGSFSDVEVLDMFLLDVKETSSVDDITKEQFMYLNQNRK